MSKLPFSYTSLVIYLKMPIICLANSQKVSRSKIQVSYIKKKCKQERKRNKTAAHQLVAAHGRLCNKTMPAPHLKMNPLWEESVKTMNHLLFLIREQVSLN